MKLTKIRSLAALAFVACSSAFAVTITDNNPADVYINLLNPSYTGQFSLLDYGYNPVSQKVDSAVAQFVFWDPRYIGGEESLSVTIDGAAFATNGSFYGVLTLGGSVVGNVLGNLSDNGVLDYTVSRTSGGISEFWLKDASLSAEVSGRTVPDGGFTVALLGLAFAGLGLVSRRWTA